MDISANKNGRSWIISLAFQQILVECIAAAEALNASAAAILKLMGFWQTAAVGSFHTFFPAF